MIKGYTFGFIFWMDFAAWLSLLFDVGIEFSLEEGIKVADQDAEVTNNEIMKLGKTSRVATKAGRIVRILRLVRLVRLLKFFKMWMAGKVDEIEPDKAKPTKIGEKYARNVTRTVVLVVIILIIVLPSFDPVAAPTFNIADHGLSELHRLPQDYNTTGSIDSAVFKDKVTAYIDTFADPNYYQDTVGGSSMDTFTSLLHLDVCTKWVGGKEGGRERERDREKERKSERERKRERKSNPKLIPSLPIHRRHCPSTWSTETTQSWVRSRFKHFADIGGPGSKADSRLKRFDAVANFALEQCYDEKLGVDLPCANSQEYIKKKYRKEEVYPFVIVGCYRACPENTTLPAVGEQWECTLNE